jgi:hypothetical protein
MPGHAEPVQHQHERRIVGAVDRGVENHSRRCLYFAYREHRKLSDRVDCALWAAPDATARYREGAQAWEQGSGSKRGSPLRRFD